ncbi:MAG: hypothetical protein ICV63_12135 [Coleofasciculus sp. Co-bin14]|nr:hypothetical protein [Coleofasciculus sp. Co-bin14]
MFKSPEAIALCVNSIVIPLSAIAFPLVVSALAKRSRSCLSPFWRCLIGVFAAA